MKLPRDLSGRELADALCRTWSYRLVHTEEPSHQRIAIPAHRYLKIGTLNSILRMIATHKGIAKDEIAKTVAR